MRNVNTAPEASLINPMFIQGQIDLDFEESVGGLYAEEHDAYDYFFAQVH